MKNGGIGKDWAPEVEPDIMDEVQLLAIEKLREKLKFIFDETQRKRIIALSVKRL